MNLSSKTLSPTHMSLLDKGLSFVPTTQSDDFKVTVDLFRFFRNIRLREFFHTATDTNNEPGPDASEDGPLNVTQFRGKSYFVPPTNRNASIETYSRLVQQDVDTLLQNKNEYRHYPNITREEKLALDDLQKDADIVIKSADKGGATIILNRSDYQTECHRQLSNDCFYKKLNGDPTPRFKKEITQLLDTFLDVGEITKKEHAFLTIQHPRIPTFYTLPKVHKDPLNPPGRPIVSGIDSLTSPLSKFVDHFIRPYAEKLPSFIKDTTDMIVLIESLGPIPDDVILATFDVESLYTNVPHEGGLHAVSHFLEQQDQDARPSKSCILTLAEKVLSLNYFRFENEFFLQTKGTAMGSPMAPNFANLYVGMLEEQKILNPTTNNFFSNVLLYKRFIDDIFVLFRGSENSLKSFLEYLNSCSDHLKFTMTYDKNQISFLDLLIVKQDDMLHTNLYRKSTDRNSLLHAKSCHPHPLKNSLPYSQFCRVKRICHKTNDFEQNMEAMKNKFKVRGYKDGQINNAVAKLENKNRTDMLKKRKREKKRHAPMFITQYSRCAQEIKPILHKHWHIIQTDESLRGIFSDPPQVVYSRGKNLRDRLVHSDLIPVKARNTGRLAPIKPGNYKCNSCAQCNSTHKCHQFKHPRSGKNIPIKGVITCSTTGVIYLITCPCGKVYVGKTTRQLKQRIAEHRSTIRRKDDTYPLACHFMEMEHTVASLRYIGIEKVETPRRGGDLDRILLQREAEWIHRLDSLAPRGLNVDFDLRCFL